MGRLEKGQWIQEDVIPPSKTGEFHRQTQKFRESISANGPFPPEKDRYHLYVSYACPWAHRTLIVRHLKALQNVVSVSVVSPSMLKDGWTFHQDFPGVIPDQALGKEFLRDIYTTADSEFSGKVTVPVLFDKKTRKIVNNESAEVLRILNSGFDSVGGNSEDISPSALRAEIDEVNAEIYDKINNGVYKAGFARTQKAYEENVRALFEALDKMEERMKSREFLVGQILTEADIRFYTTLIRFDAVYHGHFKCNLRMLKEYPNLSRYLKSLYERPAFRETTHFDHIKHHYYFSHTSINPSQVVPAGPVSIF